MPETPSRLDAYRHELSRWLQPFEWQHFATFTSAFDRSPRSWRRFMERMQKDLQFDRVFWGTEANDVRPHVHALVGRSRFDPRDLYIKNGWSFPPDKEPQQADAVWRYAAGANGMNINDENGFQTFRWGRTDVQEYDPKMGAAHYVGKYVTKQLNDYDLWTRPRR